MATKVWEF